MPFGNRWSAEEDQALMRLVAGAENPGGKVRWMEVASHLPNRDGPQCRLRWVNHLNPDIDKSSWTSVEDAMLLEKVGVLGTKWSEIVKEFPGRSDNAVKNRWNTLLRKEQRKQQKAEGGGRQPAKRKRAAAAAADADDAGAPPLAVAELVTSPTGDLPVLPPEPPLLLATATDS